MRFRVGVGLGLRLVRAKSLLLGSIVSLFDGREPWTSRMDGAIYRAVLGKKA